MWILTYPAPARRSSSTLTKIHYYLRFFNVKKTTLRKIHYDFEKGGVLLGVKGRWRLGLAHACLCVLMSWSWVEPSSYLNKP